MKTSENMKALLTERDEALDKEREARQCRIEAEMRVIAKVLRNPNGLEHCIRVNWQRLRREVYGL